MIMTQAPTAVWLDAWTNDPSVALSMGFAPDPDQWYRFCRCPVCGREGGAMCVVTEEVRDIAPDLFMLTLKRAEAALSPCPCKDGSNNGE